MREVRKLPQTEQRRKTERGEKLVLAGARVGGWLAGCWWYVVSVFLLRLVWYIRLTLCRESQGFVGRE
jgi:hypothetical protein